MSNFSYFLSFDHTNTHSLFNVASSVMVGALLIFVGSGEGLAGDKSRHFGHSTSTSNKYVGHRTGLKHGIHQVRQRHHDRKNHLPRYSRQGYYKAPSGPLVINVHKALKRRKLKITTTNRTNFNDKNRHEINNSIGGVRVIYYDTQKCESGFDCVIRLGASRSAPKVIVVGEKRVKTTPGPIIIYPPS